MKVQVRIFTEDDYRCYPGVEGEAPLLLEGPNFQIVAHDLGLEAFWSENDTTYLYRYNCTKALAVVIIASIKSLRSKNHLELLGFEYSGEL